MTGWYLMHRGWQDNAVFKDEPYTEREAWEWLIGEATYDERVVNLCGMPVKLKRGQLTHSIRHLGDKWGWSKSVVQRFLERLKNWDMIRIENGTGQNIITICNYSQYQDMRDSSGTEMERKKGQQRDSSGTIYNQDNQGNKDIAVVTHAARPVSHETKPARHSDTVSVGKTIAAITGWDADPNWFGDYARIEVWLNAGWDPELDIIPTVHRLMVGRTSPPKVLKYFEGAIADAYATRTSPIPKGSTNAPRHQQPTHSDRLAAAGREALDDIFAEIDSRFGESQSGRVGQPDPAELRDIPRLRQAAGGGEKHYPGVHDGDGGLHNRGNQGGLPDLDADAIDNADTSADFGNHRSGAG